MTYGGPHLIVGRVLEVSNMARNRNKEISLLIERLERLSIEKKNKQKQKVALIKERFGDDFYAKIGAKGGRKSQGGGFAQGEIGRHRAANAGKKSWK